MKRSSIAVLFSLLALASLQAQQSSGGDEITAVSAIEKVTVYADRAVVERKADLELKAGQSYIVFDNLPERVDPSSLQLKGRGAVVVEDLVFRSKYFAAIPDERIKALQASRDETEAKIVAVQDKISRSHSE